VVRRFGVIVDRAREVLRISEDYVEEVPEGIKRHGSNDIECICKLEGGKRLISVLSAREIFCGLKLGEADDALAASTVDVEEERSEEEDMQDVTDEHGTDDEQLVVFKLDDENFGISIHSVQEIIRLPESFVAVPNAAGEIEGLINLRGMVMPVIDMRRYFNLASCDRSERQRIVVLNVQGMLTGYIVDSVTEVLTVTAAELTPPPTLNTEAARYVQNVAKTHGGKRMVLVLDSCAFDMVDPAELEAAAEEVVEA
jgi:purine-binding chemotaxis protein CheW